MSKFTGEGLHELYAECLKSVPSEGAEFFRKCDAFDKMAAKLNQGIVGETPENVNGFNKGAFPLLFTTVSKVLGDEEAEKQLSITYESSAGRQWEDRTNLASCFYWDETRQGTKYWNDLYDNIEGVSYE